MANKILSLIPVIQSANLVSDNLKKKKGSKNLLKQGTRNLVGISLISATASSIDNL